MRKERPLAFAAVLILLASAVSAHHSFAMYDRTETVVVTGVIAGIDPNANHLLITFAPMNDARDGVLRDDNGDPLFWVLDRGNPAELAAKLVAMRDAHDLSLLGGCCGTDIEHITAIAQATTQAVA